MFVRANYNNLTEVEVDNGDDKDAEIALSELLSGSLTTAGRVWYRMPILSILLGEASNDVDFNHFYYINLHTNNVRH